MENIEIAGDINITLSGDDKGYFIVFEYLGIVRQWHVSAEEVDELGIMIMSTMPDPVINSFQKELKKRVTLQ